MFSVDHETMRLPYCEPFQEWLKLPRNGKGKPAPPVPEPPCKPCAEACATRNSAAEYRRLAEARENAANQIIAAQHGGK
jgi:hypothetical protein